jgi:hypothetical protein
MTSPAAAIARATVGNSVTNSQASDFQGAAGDTNDLLGDIQNVVFA